MGRIRKACITLLLCISLLCGCDRAGKINPELTKVSVDAAGTVTYTDKDGNVHYGQDAWGDTTPATSTTPPFNTGIGNAGIDAVNSSLSAYYSSIAESHTLTSTTLEEVIVDIPIITSNTDTTKPPDTTVGEVIGSRPTPETFDSFTKDSLLAYYKYVDSFGYYNYGYGEHCSKDGFVGQLYEGTYDEACVAFIEQLGTATFEIVTNEFTYSYWLTSDKVYSVTNYNPTNTVSIGQGYYNSNYTDSTRYDATVSDLQSYVENGHKTLSILYREFGSPTHYDSFVAVWKTATKMYVVDRRTTLTLILEV